ncbi:MAG: isochorismatase family protein [Desulfobulbaceae bacterium]|nr:isochorismatase family protein [Desulfobulbaceae bacterium]
MKTSLQELQQGDGLLIIDVQNCFSAGGSLAIEDADAIIPGVNAIIEAALREGIPVYASRDWHPKGHISFREQGGEWPPHCIADSNDAHFHPDLNLPEDVVIITKGVRFDQDQNSVFDGTGFAERLRRDGIKRLWVAGLALDVCVFASVMDALKEGFAVKLLLQATRPVNPAAGDEALRKMEEAGAKIIGN